MTLVGKLLVILNLLFAVAVGYLLFLDYAKRTDWKKRSDKLEDENQARLAIIQSKETLLKEKDSTIVAGGRSHQQDKLDWEDTRKRLEASIIREKNKITQLEKIKETAVAETRGLAEQTKRLEKEVQLVKSHADKRLETITVLDDKIAKLNEEIIKKEDELTQVKARLEQSESNLQTVTQELERAKAKAEAAPVARAGGVGAQPVPGLS